MKKITYSLLALLILPFTLSAQSLGRPTDADLEAGLRKFNQFYYYLSTLYVDTLGHEGLIEDAIRGVLNDLDPHSAYLTAEEMKDVEESFSGSFSGIGVEFDVLNDTLVVVNTIIGGPSESLGVMAGDKIVKIDNEDVVGISRNDVPKRLRGEKGSKVDIEVKRSGMDENIIFNIIRDDIPIYTVDAAYKIDNKTGYIKVNRFAATTMEEFREGMDKMKGIENVIVDLRGNGGGLLEQGIEMCEYFLNKGSVIVSTEGRAMPNSSFASRTEPQFTGKLVVLLDSSSASASEIFAGAMQDWDRGVVVGKNSFGKGLVQRQIPMGDGSAIRVTVARYHTPSGRVIQREFENGEMGDYYADHYKRITDDKYRDSMEMNAPTYKTLRLGREVKGGGGITPDIVVPIDTAVNYAFQNRLMAAGIINEVVNSYLEKNRKKIERKYPTFEEFKNEYELDDDVIDEMVEQGKKQKIEAGEKHSEKDAENMKQSIKALIARKLWSTNEYYMISNDEDDEYAKAKEVLSAGGSYNEILN